MAVADVGDEIEEVLVCDDSQATRQFDCLIGHIENIILSDEFVDLRESFMKKHCHIFSDDEENKLEYMDIYKQYTSLIEGHIEDELCARESDFDMTAFMQELAQSESLDGEVFDLLLTFTDFIAFKTSMLETKQISHLEAYHSKDGRLKLVFTKPDKMQNTIAVPKRVSIIFARTRFITLNKSEENGSSKLEDLLQVTSLGS